MNENVRDKILRVVKDGGETSYQSGMAAAGDPDADPTSADHNATTDRIIALVREAMLSAEAVEAGARAITSDPYFGDNTWDDDARNVLQAALAAAGFEKEQG